MQNVLLLAYEYAPYNRQGSVIGAQRPAGFAKYLPQFGWRPIVLCCDNNERRIWSKVDHQEIRRRVTVAFNNTADGEPVIVRLPSLMSADWIDGLWKRLTDVNEKTGTFVTTNRLKNAIRKPISFIKLFRGDHSQAWQDVALAAAESVMEHVKLDVVLAEHTPDASFFVAYKLFKRYGIPWIADTRDPVLQPFKGITRIIAKRALKNIMRTAKAQISVTPYWHHLAEQVWGIPDSLIPNGYNPDEFTNNTQQQNGPFTISFLGNISQPSDIDLFFRALHLLKEEFGTDAVRFLHRGRMKTEFLKWSNQYNVEDICDLGDSVDRRISIDMMMRSDALVLFAADTQKNQDIYMSRGYYPGKVFEYFGAQKPIICIGGRGSQLEDLLVETKAGICFDLPDEIVDYVKKLMSNKREGKSLYLPDSEKVNKYSRPNLTYQLVGLLTSHSKQKTTDRHQA